MKHRFPVSTEEDFFLHLQTAWTVTQKLTEEALQTCGLTVAEYTLLRIVENSPGITAGETRARLYSTAPSVAQMVAQLERKELLKRGKDAEDARRLPLNVTAKGSKALKNAKKAISQLISQQKLASGLLHSLTRNLSTFLSSLPPYGA
jgi:DNA-binding MarR family transcriptional regulator